MIEIVNWSEQFESADTRKRQRLKSFFAPSGCDSSGYLELMTEHGAAGIMAFGVFQMLCQQSATMKKEVRGRFVKGNGEAMSIKQISLLIRVDECHLSAALELLASESIKWIKVTHKNKEVPSICQQSASDFPALCEGEGEGEVEGEGEGSFVRKSADVETLLESIWSDAPATSRNRSSREKVRTAFRRIKAQDRPSAETLKTAILAWSKSHEWLKDSGQFVQGLHIWVKDKKWENLPEETNQKYGNQPDRNHGTANAGVATGRDWSKHVQGRNSA